MGHRAILSWALAIVVAVGLSPTQAGATQPLDACNGAWAFLQAGELEAAVDAFNASQDTPACQSGADLVKAQEERAKQLADECTKATDKLEKETDGDEWRKAYPAALATCGKAIALDASLADRLSGTLLALPDAPASDPSAAQRVDNWWSGVWANAQNAAVVAGQLLLTALISLPVLNAIGTAFGRHGPAGLRRQLGRSSVRRNAVIVPALVAIALAFTEYGSRWWVGGVALGVTALALATAFDSRSNGGLWTTLAVLGAIGGGVVYGAVGGSAPVDSVLVVAVPAFAFLLLGWVLAQHRRIRVDAFTGDETGAAIAQLVATELVRLSQPRGGDLTMVDPLPNADLDGDSVSSLAGPENKVVKAAITIFRAAFQTGTDWIVSGQLLGTGDQQRTIALQIKRGRTTIAAARIDSSIYTRSKPVESKKAEADSDKPTGPSHIELAHPAAAWVFVELQRELDGLVDGTTMDGATVPASIALHVAAAQANRTGDRDLAALLYGRAVELDPDNLPARLGFALFAVNSAPDAELPARTAHLDAVVADILNSASQTAANEPSKVTTDTELMARHAQVVANFNLLASRANESGQTREGDHTLLESTRRCLEELNARFEEAEESLSPERRHALRTSINSMDPLLPQSDLDEAAWIALARRSVRSTYNAAAIKATPLTQPGSVDESLDLLSVAAAHPGYRKAAADDPFFKRLATNDRFQELTGASPDIDADGIASLDVIGEHYAAKLKKANIDTVRTLAGAQATSLAEATGAPLSLVAVWRRVADLGTIPDLSLPRLNLLFRCGIGSRRELADADPAKLTSLIAGIAEAANVDDRPDLAMITSLIAEARTP